MLTLRHPHCTDMATTTTTTASTRRSLPPTQLRTRSVPAEHTFLIFWTLTSYTVTTNGHCTDVQIQLVRLLQLYSGMSVDGEARTCLFSNKRLAAATHSSLTSSPMWLPCKSREFTTYQETRTQRHLLLSSLNPLQTTPPSQTRCSRPCFMYTNATHVYVRSLLTRSTAHE